MAAPSISVLLPVLNGAEFLARVLEGLRTQEYAGTWDFLAIDCGSTDGTLDILQEYAARFPVPLRVHGLHGKTEFNHSDTRNLLGALSEGELLLFITDDAIPVGQDWLTTIAANFEDASIGGCFVRNIPRPEADVLAKSQSARDPGYQAGRRVTFLPAPDELEQLDAHARRELYNYNDTASCVRRSLWERGPYPRCAFGEDILLARTLLEAGYGIVYEDRAVIHHSHEYDAEMTRPRARDDAIFNAERLDRVSVRDDEDLEVEVGKQLLHDKDALEEAGLVGRELEVELARAEGIRRAYFEGAMEGGRSQRRFAMSAMNAAARFGVELLVTDGGLAFAGIGELPARLSERGWAIGGGELAHVIGDDAEELVARRLAARLPTLWSVSPDWAAAHGMTKEVVPIDELELRLTQPPLAEFRGPRADELPFELAIWRSAESVDGLRGTRASIVDWDEERVHALEIRYRGLAGRARRSRPQELLDLRGVNTSALDGEARALDQRRVLLRLGGAVEYDLRRAAPLDGSRAAELRFFVEGLEEEKEVLTGGRVLLDGELLGELGPFRSCAGDEQRVLRLPVTLSPQARTLRVESRFGADEEATLRIARVFVSDPAAEVRRASTLERCLDLRGQDGTTRGRRTDRQGCDMVLIGPKRSSLEWSLEGLAPGPHEVRLWLAFTPEETELEQHGRIWVDGVPVARFGPVSQPAGGGTRELALVVVVPRDGALLKINNTKRPAGRVGFARVQRVLVTPTERAPVQPTALQRALRLPPRLEL